MKIRLDIGSGETPREGFTGVDLFVVGDNILNAPMDKLPLPDCSVSEIYSSHALEHISKYAVIPTLREWRRVLEDGGKLTIEVPDFVYVVKQWLLYQSNDWYMDAIFGTQDNDGQYHRTGFTKPIMISYLTKAGFEGQTVTITEVFSHEQQCFIFEIEK